MGRANRAGRVGHRVLREQRARLRSEATFRRQRRSVRRTSMAVPEVHEDLLMARDNDNGNGNGNGNGGYGPHPKPSSPSGRDEVAEHLREVDEALDELDEVIGESSP